MGRLQLKATDDQTIKARCKWLRAIIPTVCTLGLAGCYSDQAQQVGACHLDAEKFVAIHMKDTDPDERMFKSGDLTTICMQAHGYATDVSGKCSEIYPIDPKASLALLNTMSAARAQSAICYVPYSWLDRQFLNLERWWRGF